MGDGWTLVDNEFVDQVARRAGLPRDEVARREERAPGLLERLARTLAALHVYVVASKPFRRRVAIERLGVDAAKVDKAIDETDHQRDQYVKTHYGRDRQDLTQYDVVLNAERMGFGGAADLIVEEVRRRGWI
ncbi:MAG: hypothetical protein DMD59_06260 [Gemmatimonadetes bacterium]|nr:MAG: hypothetical protein DMD59_06260 [Gemmatimonadota bacterium]